MSEREIQGRWDDLDDLVALWRSHRIGDLLPPRRVFEPLALKRWLGWISILAVIDGGRDYRFRLFGTRVADAVGFDMTGKSVDDYPGGRAGVLRESYQRVVDTRRVEQIAWAIISATGKPTVAWERVVLPCADDGRLTDRLIVCSIRHEFMADFDRYAALIAQRGVPLTQVMDTEIKFW
jgi:hypothetical protein